MEKKLIMFMASVVFLITVLSIPMISSFEFDNTQNVKESKGLAGYNDIEIKNAFGFGETLWSGTLNSNTNKCGDYCSSTQTIELHKKGSLVDEVIFKTLQRDGSWEEQSIRGYQIYVNNISYILGTELDAGTYEVKLEGKKKPQRTVDWIYKTQGETLNSWAVWGGGGIFCYQESANVSTACGGLATGLYALVGVWDGSTGVETFDGNWNTNAKANTGTVATMHVNYSVPDSATNESMWEAKLMQTTASETNYTIPTECWKNPLEFRIISSEPATNSINASCYNGTSWHNVLNFTDTTPDNFRIWEEAMLWNMSAQFVGLNSPVDNFENLQNITFNCSASVIATTLTNISLYTNSSGIWEITNTTDLTATNPLTNTTTFSHSFSAAKYLWSCNACDSDNDCGFATSNRTVSVISLLINNESFSNLTYETSQETYSINLSSVDTLTAGNLIYNGTTFTATNVGKIWSATVDIDLITRPINRSFFWSFNSGTINTTLTNQSILHTNFSLCGGEGGDVPFLNFTFFNETINEESVNATISSAFVYWLGTGVINKTETFANSTENPIYSFCSTPPDRTLNINYLIDYNNAESQQRSFTEERTVTNTTLVKSLFLLPSSLGIFTTFRTEDTVSNILSLVTGTITRTISGSTITVASGLTDSSGIVVFFLNPDITYSGSFSKTGFVTNNFVFVPITDIRVVVLGITGAVIGGTDISQNMSYQTFPLNSSLQNNTDFLFGFDVNASETLTLISMNITSPNGTQLGFQSNAGAGFISETINTKNFTIINGAFVIQTSNETIKFVRIWIVGNDFIGDYSLFRQLGLFLDYEFKDFTRLLIVIAVIFGLMIFLTAGQITDTSESQIAVLIILVWIFSVVGWLQNPIVVSTTGLAQFSAQHGIAILVTAGGLFFILRRLLIRRI